MTLGVLGKQGKKEGMKILTGQRHKRRNKSNAWTE